LIATLLHLSDLHFGPPLRPHLPDLVVREAHQLSPDVVIVSGDLTQRARIHQFARARRFLDRLPPPQVVIPGNHDVPLYNLFLRFAQPLKRYRAAISETPDVALAIEGRGIGLVGLNSTRSFTIDGGRLRERQLRWAQTRFDRFPSGACRIVAVHHHFMADGGHQPPIRRAARLLQRFRAMGVELILVGHRHWARAERPAGGPLVVQAGTATSRRGKGEERGLNSYNVIQVDRTAIRVTCHRFQPARQHFEPAWTQNFWRSIRPQAGRV
jgi:3',5'-cyclic AMP phosphodiesterase CpdA